jgi:hypothetical protein
MIKAIETHYNGYDFRSRLEARWAVFFDMIGVPYKYEEQGFELPSGRYLPDFWMPEQNCYIEIKGVEPTTEEEHLAQQLSDITGKRVHIFFGDIPQPESLDYDMYALGSSYVFFPGSIRFEDRKNAWDWTKNGLKPNDYPTTEIDVELSELKPSTLAELVAIDQSLDALYEQTNLRGRIKVKHLRNRMSLDAWRDISTTCALEDRDEWDVWIASGGFDQPYVWGQCLECGKFSIGFSGWDERLACKGNCGICMEISRRGYWQAFEKGDIYKKCPHHDIPRDGCYSRRKQESWAAPRLITAYRTARSARFEFGQTPKVPRAKVQRGKPKK